MITQFFGENIFGKLIKTGANSVQLQAGSRLRVGGLGLRLDSALNVDTTTNGLGGLDTGSQQAGKLYYVYAVISGASFGLVASLSEISPVGFLLYRKVGAFTSNQLVNEVEQSLSFGEQYDSSIKLHKTKTTNGGFGSTGTAIILWLDIIEILGLAVTYQEDEINGDSFLINHEGIYQVNLNWACDVTDQEFAITKNGDTTSTTATVNTNNPELVISMKRNHPAGLSDEVSGSSKLGINDLVRARRNASAASANVGENRFSISKIGTNEVNWG